MGPANQEACLSPTPTQINIYILQETEYAGTGQEPTSSVKQPSARVIENYNFVAQRTTQR